MGLMGFFNRKQSKVSCSHNSDSDLKEKAALLAQSLVEDVRLQHSILLKKISELSAHIDTSDSNELMLELVLIQIHLADRISFIYLSTKQRDTFIDAAVMATAKQLYMNIETEMSDDDNLMTRMRQCVEFMKVYNTKQVEYSTFSKVIPDREESAKGTLLWEFGVRTARQAKFSPINVASISEDELSAKTASEKAEYALRLLQESHNRHGSIISEVISSVLRIHQGLFIPLLLSERSEAMLYEKGLDIAKSLVENVRAQCSAIMRLTTSLSEQVSPKAPKVLLLQLVLIQLVLVDRVVSTCINTEKGSVFMGYVLAGTAMRLFMRGWKRILFFMGCNMGYSRISTDFADAYTTFRREYSKYPIVSLSQNQGNPKGTFLWEASIKAVELIGLGENIIIQDAIMLSTVEIHMSLSKSMPILPSRMPV